MTSPQAPARPTPTDPEAMDWRQIQTALIGTSFSSEEHRLGGEGWDHLTHVESGTHGSPQSLFTASQMFNQLGQQIEQIHQQLKSRRRELVESGRWSGSAASSFDQVATQMESMVASTLRPLVGSRSYGNLLDRAAVALSSAQNEIVALNHQGAVWTKERYDYLRALYLASFVGGRPRMAAPVTPWFEQGSQVVYTPSTYPDIDQKMTDMARQTMLSIVRTYRIVSSDLTPPVGAAAPLLNPNASLPDLSSLPGAGGAGGLPSGLDLPASPGLDGSGSGLPGSPDLPGLPGGSGGTGIGTPEIPEVPASPALPTSPGLPTSPALPTSPGLPTSPALPVTPALPTSPALPSVGGSGGGGGTPRSPGISSSFPFSGEGRGGGGALSSGIDAPGTTALTPGGGTPPGGSVGPTSTVAGTLGAGAAGQYGGMPMMPMMPMAPGGANSGQDERERSTWLLEDRDIWSVTTTVAPGVVTGSAVDHDDETTYVVNPTERVQPSGTPRTAPAQHHYRSTS